MKTNIQCLIRTSVLIATVATMPTYVISSAKGADIILKSTNETFQLTDPAKLLNDTAIKGAERVAELAESALLADANGLAREETALTKAEAALVANRAQVQQELNEHGSHYQTGLNAYRKRLSVYEGEVGQQTTAAAASNALPPERRNAATVARLNTWKQRLDSRQAVLTQEQTTLEKERVTALNFEKSAISADKMEYDRLVSLRKRLQARQGEAYRQLKQCHEYALVIRKLLADPSRIERSEVPSKTWHATEELLKEWSSKGFDGNTDKPQLTD